MTLDITDATRCYRTRAGHKAVILAITPLNAIGQPVTFPVKCSIREEKRGARRRYQILTLEGRARVLRDHRDDIVGLWEPQPLP